MTVAFQAMVHFLAKQWNAQDLRELALRQFIESISDGWDNPATPDIAARFREAAEDAWNREEPDQMRS